MSDEPGEARLVSAWALIPEDCDGGVRQVGCQRERRRTASQDGVDVLFSVHDRVVGADASRALQDAENIAGMAAGAQHNQDDTLAAVMFREATSPALGCALVAELLHRITPSPRPT